MPAALLRATGKRELGVLNRPVRLNDDRSRPVGPWPTGCVSGGGGVSSQTCTVLDETAVVTNDERWGLSGWHGTDRFFGGFRTEPGGGRGRGEGFGLGRAPSGRWWMKTGRHNDPSGGRPSQRFQSSTHESHASLGIAWITTVEAAERVAASSAHRSRPINSFPGAGRRIHQRTSCHEQHRSSLDDDPGRHYIIADTSSSSCRPAANRWYLIAPTAAAAAAAAANCLPIHSCRRPSPFPCFSLTHSAFRPIPLFSVVSPNPSDRSGHLSLAGARLERRAQEFLSSPLAIGCDRGPLKLIYARVS